MAVTAEIRKTREQSTSLNAGDLASFSAARTSANRSSATGQPGTTILNLFHDAVQRYSGNVAVSDTDGFLTYAQLWNLADCYRDRLFTQGVRRGDLVGVAAGRSLRTVAAILGVVMAEGCYVPVNLEEFPGSSLKQLAEECGLCHWIADQNARTSGILPAGASTVLSLEDVSSPPEREVASIRATAIDANSPLYVMFTSGSTGQPKGVVVPHRAVMRLVDAQNFMQFGSEYTFLLHSPLSFDASTLEFWGSLLHGSRLIVAPNRSLSLDDYAQLVRKDGVDTLWLTAALFHLAAEHAPQIFAPLRQLLFGGDVVSPQYVERIRERYPNLHMVNGYGPTENTTFTCCYVVPKEYKAEGSLPIGLPIVGTTIHVLDAGHQPVAAGQEGELAAGGAGVALGYLAQPQATADQFIRDTFSSDPDARLYLTGDRVRQRPDGVVEFFGRIDRQIKLAGHRVELAAVENAICSSPLVSDAGVVVLAPSTGEKQLAACVSLLQPLVDAEAQLRQWLHDRISRIAIPRYWLFLKRLPLNANGKLDRRQLQALCEQKFLAPSRSDSDDLWSDSAHADKAGVPEISQITRQLCRLWARLLGREAIGEDENFFDLGGTSLLLIEMHARLRAQFIEVPSLVEMFAFPTPRALASRLHGGRRTPRAPQAAEQRGERQRKALLARRPGMTASNAAVPRTVTAGAGGEDGAR